MKKLVFKILVLCALLMHIGCTSLKPYQRIYVNDPEMSMSGYKALTFGHYMQSIREAGVSATGTKGSGGCGCN